MPCDGVRTGVSERVCGVQIVGFAIPPEALTQAQPAVRVCGYGRGVYATTYLTAVCSHASLLRVCARKRGGECVGCRVVASGKRVFR